MARNTGQERLREVPDAAGGGRATKPGHAARPGFPATSMATCPPGMVTVAVSTYLLSAMAASSVRSAAPTTSRPRAACDPYGHPVLS